MKEICRENSTRGGMNMSIAYTVLLIICGFWGYDAYRMQNGGGFSPLGTGLAVLWLGIWIWKVYFKYELILRENELEVISIGLGMHRSYKVDLNQLESFSEKYQHSFFRKTRINHYIHRYSMADPNTTRILCFREGKGIAALLFCCSDKFLRELKRLKPDQYLGF